MKTPAKIWLWILIVINVVALINDFASDTVNGDGWITLIETLVMLAAVAMILFLKMKAGFYLLRVYTVADLFYVIALFPMLVLYLLIGAILRIGITWLCIRSSWSEMK